MMEMYLQFNCQVNGKVFLTYQLSISKMNAWYPTVVILAMLLGKLEYVIHYSEC